MPRYKCHKEVHALQIRRLESRDDGIKLYFMDEKYSPIEIANPEGGRIKKALIDHAKPLGDTSLDTGYLVVYAEDGYRSWSPSPAFEAGYDLM